MLQSEQHVKDMITGCAAERFFRRKPKSLLPNNVEREVDWRNMLTEGTNQQAKLATSKRERKSREEFKPGDKVIIQEQTGRKQWIDTGVIDEARVSDDGSNQSFLITLDRGGSCLRNKRFIKHWRDTTYEDRENDAQPDAPHMNTTSQRRNE